MENLLGIYPKQPSKFIGEILKVVSQESTIPINVILTKSRKREVVEQRQKAMSLAKTFTGASLATIGLMIGNKDHATVLHACKTVNNLMDTDKNYKGDYTNMYIKIGRIIEMIPGELYACSKCGSIYVQTKAWVTINNKKFVDEIEVNDEFNNWCPDCQESVKVILLSEYIAAKNEKEESTTEPTLT